MNQKITYVHNANFNSINANKIQVVNMCNAFIENNCEVELLTFGKFDFIKKNYPIHSKIKISSFESNLNYYFRSFILFLKTKNAKKKDLIFTRDIIYSTLMCMFKPKSFIIYELHEIKKNTLWKKLLKFVFKNTKKIVVISNGLKEELVENGFDSNKIKVFHDGVDLNKFDLKISQEQARKKLNINHSNKIVLYIGSFQEWKGYLTFLKASELNKDENILFYAIGAKKEEIDKLQKKFNKIKLLEFVEQKKVPLWLKAADALIIPNSAKFKISTHYTSPLKLFEYMASKRLIISSEIKSLKEIVSKNEVIFFKADNSKDLYNKIQLEINNNKNSKIISNAYEKVQDFSWKKRVEKILKIKNE